MLEALAGPETPELHARLFSAKGLPASGTSAELLAAAGISARRIAAAARQLLQAPM